MSSAWIILAGAFCRHSLLRRPDRLGSPEIQESFEFEYILLVKGNQMKRIVIAVLLFVCLSSLASAQANNGYVFFAPGQIRGGGGSSMFLHFGGGMKHMMESRLGFGGELGLWGPKQHFSDSYGGHFSLNSYYKMDITSSKKLVPFMTIGYTRTFGHDSGGNWVNFGGGLDYWFREKMGAMVEFRDHVHRESKITFNLWEIRVGLAFR